MLELLEEANNGYIYNNELSSILCEQDPRLKFVLVKKLKVKNISKSGDEITVRVKTSLEDNAAGFSGTVLILRLDKGI